MNGWSNDSGSPPRVGLSFESIDAVRNVLTPKRLGLELKRGHGKRSPLEPRVRYDSIRLDIPLHGGR